jgi:membrane-bound serine protease (ClpP class)
MKRFASMIQEASREGLLTVAWVNGEATSAGALIALACERLYLRASATIGSATPVQATPGGIAPIPAEGGLQAKLYSYVRARFRAVAEENRRPAALAEAMVDGSVEVREVRIGGERKFVTGKEWDDLMRKPGEVELVRTVVREGEVLNVTGTEAAELGLSDGLAESLGEVLARVGKGGATPVELRRTRSEETLAFLERIAPLLLGLGLLLGWMEIKSPGFGVPGLLAIACFAVLLGGRYLTGLADVPHIVLVLVGLALIAVELFLAPGTVWFGVTGGVCVLTGLVLVELGPGFDPASALDRRFALDAAFQLALIAGGTLVGAWMLSRYLPDMPVLNRLVQTPRGGGAALGERARLAQPGAEGLVRTALHPVGKVVLAQDPGLEFEARAEGEWVEAGERVRIVEVVGGRLVVRPSSARPLAGGGSGARAEAEGEARA